MAWLAIPRRSASSKSFQCSTRAAAYRRRIRSLCAVEKHCTRKQCEQLVARFLRAVHQPRQAGLVQLGQTLAASSEEIVAMWRFTRNNGITKDFHNKMELINRQAYGFRNFQNYRLRLKVLCSKISLGSGIRPRCWRRAHEKGRDKWSGRVDSNHRPPGPEP